MTGPADTTPDMLCRAAAIGRQAGLQFVYAGNQPGGWATSRTPRVHTAASP